MQELAEASLQGAKLSRADLSGTAFQNDYFAGIDGLIWSRRSSGNFLGNTDDLVYVHNQLAKRPLPRRWMNWQEEYFPVDGAKKLRRIKRKA